MVGAMRGTPEGFRAEQASGSQQPPPPPPNLAEVMARQTELLNLLVQAQQNQQRQQFRGGRDDCDALKIHLIKSCARVIHKNGSTSKP
jgi:hypothetical protein